MRKITLTAAAGLLLFMNSAYAQLSNVSFLNGGVNDAQLLFKGYLDPWAKSIGAGLDAGWYNSAKPHSTLGFDVTFTTSYAFVPSSERSFDVSQIGLKTLSVKGTENIAQTIAGKNADGAELELKVNNKSVGGFKMPAGTGVSGVPLPMIKVGFGLPFGTEIDARFLPTLSLGSKLGSIGLWGVGLKHSIKQWIPVVSLVPFWDLSLVGAYSRFNTSANVNFTPSDMGANFVYDGSTTDFNGQKAQFSVGAWNVGMVIGTSLPIFNVYGGIGYSSSQANLKLTGKYYTGSVSSVDGSGKVHVKASDLKTDPINFDFDKNGNMKYTAGMRVKLALLTIHADYSYANYSMYTAGVGISFR